MNINLQQECRCCGKYVPGWYAYGDNSEFNIHTMCIAKHWGKHARGVNHSRCKEFKKKKADAALEAVKRQRI
jgi:hypothetical protein